MDRAGLPAQGKLSSLRILKANTARCDGVAIDQRAAVLRIMGQDGPLCGFEEVMRRFKDPKALQP